MHTFETPASLRVLAQTFNWGSDRNILSGSELRKRNLAIEVFRSQWPTQCAHMSDIPDFNRFCRQDWKILRALLDFFFWTVKYFESAANLKMQNEKYTFIFILNIENMESALPVKRKIKKLWPNFHLFLLLHWSKCKNYTRFEGKILYKIPTENAQTHLKQNLKKLAWKRHIRQATDETMSPMVRITTSCGKYGTYNHRQWYV